MHNGDDVEDWHGRSVLQRDKEHCHDFCVFNVKLLLHIWVYLYIFSHYSALGLIFCFFWGPNPFVVIPNSQAIDGSLHCELNQWTNGIHDHRHSKLVTNIAIPIIWVVIVIPVEHFSDQTSLNAFFHIGKLDYPSCIEKSGHEDVVTYLTELLWICWIPNIWNPRHCVIRYNYIDHDDHHSDSIINEEKTQTRTAEVFTDLEVVWPVLFLIAYSFLVLVKTETLKLSCVFYLFTL